MGKAKNINNYNYCFKKLEQALHKRDASSLLACHFTDIERTFILRRVFNVPDHLTTDERFELIVAILVEFGYGEPDGSLSSLLCL